MHKRSKTPDVSTEAVILPGNNLWGGVSWSANHKVCSLIGGLQLDSAAEVCNLDLSISRVTSHQEVFELNVSVDDKTRVQRFYTLRDLSYNHPSVLLIQRLVWLLAHII